MTNLQTILQHARERRLKAGGAVSTELRSALVAHRQRQWKVFVIIEALLVIAVGLCAYYITTSSLQQWQLKMLTGVLGIGAGGGVEVMRRIWKEWSQTDLLLTLITEASEAQVGALIDKLIGRV